MNDHDQPTDDTSILVAPTVPSTRPCPECKGQGSTENHKGDMFICETCAESGVVPAEKESAAASPSRELLNFTQEYQLLKAMPASASTPASVPLPAAPHSGPASNVVPIEESRRLRVAPAPAPASASLAVSPAPFPLRRSAPPQSTEERLAAAARAMVSLGERLSAARRESAELRQRLDHAEETKALLAPSISQQAAINRADRYFEAKLALRNELDDAREVLEALVGDGTLPTTSGGHSLCCPASPARAPEHRAESCGPYPCAVRKAIGFLKHLLNDELPK